MKLLKLTLSDEKTYTLKTFSILELVHLSKKKEHYEKLQEDMDAINFETTEDGSLKKDSAGKLIPKLKIDEKGKEKLKKIEQELMDFGIDILRKSLSSKHPEFKKCEDKVKDKEISEKAMDLVDATDLRKIVNFAFTGIYRHEDNVIDDVIEFDLPSEDSNAETKK